MKLFSAFTSRKETSETTCEYLQVRNDVLESARASYKADPEKKQTAEREGYHADPEKKRSAKRESYEADPAKKQTEERERYHADPEKKRSAKRESYEADPTKKQTEERERYHADPEKKRSAERKRYWEGPECARLAKRVRYGKAKRTLQNQRGHRKKNYRQSYSKVCKCRCSNLHSISDIEQGLHMTLAETLRQRCLVSDAWFEYSSATT